MERNRTEQEAGIRDGNKGLLDYNTEWRSKAKSWYLKPAKQNQKDTRQ